jgi:hypothetical protein
MAQINELNLYENHIIEICKEEGCAVTTQKSAAQRKWENGKFDTFIGSLDR